MIPVVDFSVFSLEREPESVTQEELEAVSAQLYEAFTGVGFVFLQNTGISPQEVERVMEVSLQFFLLSEEQKKNYSRGSFREENHGWVSLETERLNPRLPGDLKESFNTAQLSSDIKWPSGGVLKDFQQIQTSFFRRCRDLGLRVLRVMAHSLNLEPELFLKPHSRIGEDGNSTTLRSLYYPPIDPDQAKEGQLRCGEHSDYGSITLLFQSGQGLQVRSRSGEFLSAPCVPGAVLINIADAMQRWTSDRFVSALHRVLLPAPGDPSIRQSLAFFMHPDDSALIGCFDGSDKYPPITAGKYLSDRFNDSYGRT